MVKATFAPTATDCDASGVEMLGDDCTVNAGVKTARDWTSRAVADFHDIVTLPLLPTSCVEPAASELGTPPVCGTMNRRTIPALLVTMFAAVEPAAKISATQEPGTSDDRLVVMVFAVAV